MKVLMTTDTFGGVWHYSTELASGLGRLGVQVTLATLGRPMSAFQRAALHKIPNVEVVESDYKLEWMDQPWEDVEKSGRWLLELEDRYRPDVLHFNHFCHGDLPFVTPKLVVGHSCVYSWWQAVHRSEPPESWQRYHRGVQRGLDSADQVIAPTRAMLDSLRRIYRSMLPSSRVIPNGRDWRAPQRTKEPLILAVGRFWDQGKNLRAVGEIAGELSWPVFAAGDIRDPAGTFRAVEEFPDVHFLGELDSDQLRDHYARASIFVHPAYYEPFGLAVLEAAAAGCALVLGDIPSLRENWEGAALFVAPDDPEDLRQTLDFLLTSEADRELLSERARSRAERFSPERMALAYFSEYEALISRRGSAEGSSGGVSCAS